METIGQRKIIIISTYCCQKSFFSQFFRYSPPFQKPAIYHTHPIANIQIPSHLNRKSGCRKGCQPSGLVDTNKVVSITIKSRLAKNGDILSLRAIKIIRYILLPLFLLNYYFYLERIGDLLEITI